MISRDRNHRQVRQNMKPINPKDKLTAFRDKPKRNPKRREIVIDESGFITNPDLWLEHDSSSTDLEGRNRRPYSSKISLKPENIFAKISSVREGSGKDRTIKKRINPYRLIECPFCEKSFFYHVMFDHISSKHKQYNPKIVLAEINRALRGEK